mgnify:CR=1 FL=1
MVHYPLVVLIDSKLLFREVIGLQSNLQFVCSLRGVQKFSILGLVNSFDEVKVVVSLLGLVTRLRMQSSGLFHISIAQDKLVESVDSLSLISGWLELTRIKTDSVVRAA